MLLSNDLSKRSLYLLCESETEFPSAENIILPAFATICTASTARRGSSWGRFAAIAATSLTVTTPTPTTLAQCGKDSVLGPELSRRLHGRRSFAPDRQPLVRRTMTDVVERSTIGVFTPFTASLWIERLQREAGATLPPKPAEGPLPLRRRPWPSSTTSRRTHS